MATLTPAYKDYVNFLDAYKSGSKRDLVRTSSVLASSTSGSSLSTKSALSSSDSSSSLASDLTDSPLLEAAKPKKPDTMRSEIFIEIQPAKSVSEVSRMFELKEKKLVTKSSKINSKISVFEKNDPKPRVINKPAVPRALVLEPVLISGEKLATSTKRVKSAQEPAASVQLIKNAQESAGTVQQLVENAQEPTTSVQQLIRNAQEPVRVVQQPIEGTSVQQLIKNAQPAKVVHVKNAPEPVISVQHVKTTQPVKTVQQHVNMTQHVNVVQQHVNMVQQPVSSVQQHVKVVQQPVDPAKESSDDWPLPPPPPLESSTADEDFPPPPPPLLDTVDSAPAPPPPPPLPQEARVQAALTRTVSGPMPTEIDRNNPAVKKLVYGALRGLYGAYHDKANDIVATLPRSMVVRSNGVQDRIEQIASCGGLEKLNGRVNPKLDQE